MADVIPFAPRRRPLSPEAPDEAPQQADILFFTSVRYERQPEPHPAAEPSRPGERSSRKPAAKSARQPA